MIEIVYKEDKKEANGNEGLFYLPKNIRQIGDIRGARKIYVEDYVYTFLKRMSVEKETVGHVAILLGRYKWTEGKSYLFIQSAMELEDMEVSMEHIQFTDKIWGEVHDTMERYFKGQEILGWVLSLPGFNFDINDVILKTHLNHFAGSDKVLLLMEPTEKEELFYYYENGRLQREGGYYIYYEKNEPMQEYMIAKGKNRSIEDTEKIPDRAVSNFRRVLEQKQEPQEGNEEKSGHNMVYALATCVAVAVLAVGFTYARDAGALPGVLSRFNNSQDAGATAAISNQGDATNQNNSNKQGSGQKDVTGNSTDPNNTQPSADSTDDGAAAGSTSGADTTPTATPTATPTPTPTTPEVTDSGNSSAETSGQATATKEYIVKKGDTLSKICMANYGNMSMIQQICDLNQLENAELIFEGQKLILPQ